MPGDYKLQKIREQGVTEAKAGLVTKAEMHWTLLRHIVQGLKEQLYNGINKFLYFIS